MLKNSMTTCYYKQTYLQFFDSRLCQHISRLQKCNAVNSSGMRCFSYVLTYHRPSNTLFITPKVLVLISLVKANNRHFCTELLSIFLITRIHDNPNKFREINALAATPNGMLSFSGATIDCRAFSL